MPVGLFVSSKSRKRERVSDCARQRPQGAAGHAADSSKSLLKAGGPVFVSAFHGPRVRFDACRVPTRGSTVGHSIPAEGLARTPAGGLYFGGLLLGWKSRTWKNCRPRGLLRQQTAFQVLLGPRV